MLTLIVEQNPDSQKYYFLVANNLMLIAALLYLVGFFRGTSFFLDELNLARNIAELTYFELLYPLKYEQYGPPFFLLLVKVGADIFGYSELGLRLIPLLASLVSLVFWLILLHRFFKNWLILYPFILLAFNFYLYQQGLALKQYSFDVLLTIFWFFWAVKRPIPKGKDFLIFGILGSISVWLSMPVVFILTGVGVYFIWKKWEIERVHSKSKIQLLKDFSPIFFIIGMWLISFALLFWINLRHGIQTNGLQSYHSVYFLKFPTSIPNIEQSWGVIIGIFRAIVGKTTLALAWAILVFVLGVFKIWRQEKSLLLLLVLPVLTCFFASLLHYYSLIIRLTLFLFPLLIFIMSFGVSFLLDKIKLMNQIPKWIAFGSLLFLLFFSCLHRSALPYFSQEYVRGNPRLILNEISKSNEATIPFYATHFGVPAYDFYTKYYEPPIVIDSPTIIYGNWNDDLTILVNKWKLQGIEQIWIFDSHTFGEAKAKLNAEIEEIGVIENKFFDVYADGVLVRLK